MKRKVLILLFLILLLPIKTYALSASCSSSGTVTLNNTITVTVSANNGEEVMWDTSMTHDSSKLEFIGGSSQRSISDSFSTAITYTYKFKAIGVGSAQVSTNSSASDYYGTKSYANSTCNINVVEASSVNTNNSSKKSNKSTDNSLKSLLIEGYQLSPEFNSETLEYKLDVPSDTSKIKIIAEKNNSKASISGDGEMDVVEGENKFEIIVTAENGSTRTYTVNVNVLEKEPIIVKINNKEYTVIRKKDVIPAPEGFEETTININGEDVLAYKNEKIDILLVGLKNNKNEAHFYIFDENDLTYKKYIEINTNSIRVVVLESTKSDIPHKYYKSTFYIDKDKINCYVFDEKSDFRLVYGINIENGEKDFYVYDIKEKTIQRFYNEQTIQYINLIKKCKVGFYTLGGILLFLLLIIIILLAKNVKFKRQYLENVNEPKQRNSEEIEYKNIEETKTMEPLVEEKVSKKELKKKNKEKKKIEKQERKTFLDE